MCCGWERGLQQCLGLFPPVLPSVASLPGRDSNPQGVRLGASVAAAGRAQRGQSSETPTQTKQAAKMPVIYCLQQLPWEKGERAKRKSGRRGLSSSHSGGLGRGV